MFLTKDTVLAQFRGKRPRGKNQHIGIKPKHPVKTLMQKALCPLQAAQVRRYRHTTSDLGHIPLGHMLKQFIP
jgi:hypothetical protein